MIVRGRSARVSDMRDRQTRRRRERSAKWRSSHLAANPLATCGAVDALFRPMDSPSPDLAALLSWVSGMDRGTRERGAAYSTEKRVKLLALTSDRIAGVVDGSESSPYRTTLNFEPRSGRWSSSCDCPVGIGCKHAVALALTVLAAAPDVAGESGDDENLSGAKRTGDFAQRACDALGRDLTRKETLALRALEEACAPTKYGRPVRASIEAALHTLIGNDYAVLNRLPAELESSATSPEVLLAAVAAALDFSGKAAPAWVGELVTRMGSADTFEREKQERVVRDWTLAIGSLNDGASAAPPESKATAEMRLRQIGPRRFQWELREHAGAEWTHLAPGERQEILRTNFDPESRFSRAGARVAELFRRFARSATNAIAFDTRDLPPGKSFGEMMRQTAMRAAAVDEFGAPLVRHEQPLVWAFAPSPRKQGHARPFLADASGKPASDSLLSLGVGLYLSDEGLWQGPSPLGGYDGTGSPPDIPAAVFDDPSVRSALKSSGARLPETFSVNLVPVTPLVTVTLTPISAGSEHSRAVATLSGVDAAERIRVVMTDGVWREKTFPGDAPDTLSLDRARRHFFTGPRHLGDQGTAYITDTTVGGFADWLSGFPAGTRFDLPPELAALVKPADLATLAGELVAEREGRDWFDLKLVLRAEDAELTKAEMKLLMAHAGNWVRLPDKGWRRLETSVSNEARDALKSLGLDADKVSLGETHRFHAAQLAGEKADALFDAVSAGELRRRADNLAAFDAPELPAGLNATLRPYQKEGFHFLAHLSANDLGGILADDMGLGKTVQTLAWLLWLKETRKPDANAPDAMPRFLVVAPKSVTGNWVGETGRFAPGLKVAVYGVDGYEDCARADIVVTSYARLRLATVEFLSTEWHAVVLDEGQHIKTPTSQIAESVRALRARHRVILSGTPVENRLLDLWSLFAFAMPGLLGSQASFKRQYDEKRDTGAAGRLASRVRPFLLRRTKAQVATDLPERIEEDIVVDLEPKQRKLYDAEMKKVRAMLLATKTSKDFDRDRFHILSSLLRLRQICCDARLVSPNAKAGDSAKLDALWEILEPLVAEGHKVLVFSQFTGVLDLVAEHLREKETPHLMLTGATENRTELVERFQKPDTEKVFLLSLKAAGTGLNLTAASYVVLFDPWWNPAAEAQAIDRTHRIGQKNRVIAYRLVARNTVEEKIRALQREKAALAGEILREESLSKVLDIDTLRGILAE